MDHKAVDPRYPRAALVSEMSSPLTLTSPRSFLQGSLAMLACVVLLLLLSTGAQRADAFSQGFVSLNIDDATAEHCQLESCFSRLSYCWFRETCVCQRNDSLCVAKCAMCMDDSWFRCCPCTGLCSLDARPRLRQRAPVTLDNYPVDVQEVFGTYSDSGRRHEEGLLEKIAAAVDMRSGEESPFSHFLDLSLWQFDVSVRKNTRKRPVVTTEATTTTASQEPTEPAATNASRDSTEAATTKSETTSATEANANTTSAARNTSSDMDTTLRRSLNKYQDACDMNQCVTIYAKSSIYPRDVCWEVCDAMGARSWHWWDTGSCECRSPCCRRPKGHKRPIHYLFDFEEI